MLQWIEREVSSPYGDVATLHWAVPDTVNETTGEHGADDSVHNNARHTKDNVFVVDDEALESAENQLGAVLWNSNTAALEYLHKHVFTAGQRKKKKKKSALPLCGKNVIELGAGVGCLGIALAMAGAHVVITDLKELLPLMQHNVRRNATRVAQRSSGTGSCAAAVWKWGPSVSLNLKKRLKKERSTTTTTTSNGNSVVQVAAEAIQAALQPSMFWQACQDTLRNSAVDYVILCDALYGNPKDWPQVLYTLSEILEANPVGCEVINFCEQRVNEVEAGFLQLLRDENAKPAIQLKDKDGNHSSSCTVKTICAILNAGNDASSCDSDEAFSPAALLDYVLRLKRGNYVWDYCTEVVTEQQSELQMTIHATRLRWRKRRDE